MNFQADESQNQWIKRMQAICKDVIEPSASDVDKERFIPRENFQALISSGFAGLVISEKYGGVGEKLTTAVLAGQILARSCPSTYFSFLSHAWRIGPSLEKYGTDDQKSKYLPGLASGQIQGGWALAERSSGSAFAFTSTIAKKIDGGYVLNGTKAFVTGASAADMFLVVARIDSEDGPMAVFVVDRHNDGLQRSDRARTVGMRGAYVADLILENCEVDDSALLVQGEICDEMLVFNRNQNGIAIATLGSGIIEAVMNLSIERATTRVVGGRKLGKFQEVHFKIAQMKTAYDAVLQIALRAAYAQDMDEDATVLAAAARVQAAESAAKATEDAMQIFGGAGYLTGSIIERFWRDARFLKIAGESTEATRRRIADLELEAYKQA